LPGAFGCEEAAKRRLSNPPNQPERGASKELALKFILMMSLD
jgi:hypothetical protein